MGKAKKDNRQFMILSAIGIIFVVDSHAWSPIAVLGNIMPYNSYFMPLFLFISGYFFKTENSEHCCAYILKKVKTLLLPFLIWNFIYGVLINLLKKSGRIYYGEALSVRTIFLEPFLGCEQFSINTPGWFVPALFMVTVVYVCLRRFFSKVWNDYLATVCFLMISIWCIALSRKGYSAELWKLPAIKTGFLLFFYELGVFFRVHMETYYRKVPRVFLLTVPLLINTVICYFSPDLNFVGIATMSGFVTDHYWIPVATSITGIVFWLTVSDILVPALGENKVVNYVSNHTFTIMLHHIFFFNVYNVILAVMVKSSILDIPLDFEAMRSSAWYRYDPVKAYAFWYVLFGVCGPLAVGWLGERIKRSIGKTGDIHE